MNIKVILLFFLFGFFLRSFAHSLITSLEVETINSLYFKLHVNTTRLVRLYAIYYDTEGNEDSLRTRKEDSSSKYHLLDIVRLLQETNYTVDIYDHEMNLLRSIYLLTGSLPTRLYQTNAGIKINGTNKYGMTLGFLSFLFYQGDSAYIYRIDKYGRIVWYIACTHPINNTFTGLGYLELDNHEIIVNRNDRLTQYLPDGTIHKENVNACQVYHHEISLYREQVYTLGQSVKQWPPTILSGNFSRYQFDDTFVQWDREINATSVFGSWSDLIGFTVRTNYSNIPTPFYTKCHPSDPIPEDWIHANSLAKSQYNDDWWIANSRSLSKFAIFEQKNGRIKLIATIGGPESNFTFLNNDDIFYKQHHVRQLKNGDITIYDNGDNILRNYSRGLVIRLNWNDMTVEKIWDFPLKHCFSFCCGSLVATRKDEYLLNFGDCGDVPIEHAYLYHLRVKNDKDVQILSNMTVPIIQFSALYRAFPSSSIVGETQD